MWAVGEQKGEKETELDGGKKGVDGHLRHSKLEPRSGTLARNGTNLRNATLPSHRPNVGNFRRDNRVRLF